MGHGISSEMGGEDVAVGVRLAKGESTKPIGGADILKCRP